jgi:hypothetical protein
MEEWMKLTEMVVSDSKKLADACNVSGAGDEHAFRLILNATNYEERIERKIGEYKVTFKGVPCSILNEIRIGAPITEQTHIIHYKGGTHTIFLFESSKLILQKESLGGTFIYFDQMLKEAKRWASENVVFNSCSNYMEKFKCIIEKKRDERKNFL